MKYLIIGLLFLTACDSNPKETVLDRKDKCLESGGFYYEEGYVGGQFHSVCVY